MYVALHEVTCCMVYTELAPRRQHFHVAPATSVLKYTTLVDIQKRAIKKKEASHSCRITCKHSESAQETEMLKAQDRLAAHEGTNWFDIILFCLTF